MINCEQKIVALVYISIFASIASDVPVLRREIILLLNVSESLLTLDYCNNIYKLRYQYLL